MQSMLIKMFTFEVRLQSMNEFRDDKVWKWKVIALSENHCISHIGDYVVLMHCIATEIVCVCAGRKKNCVHNICQIRR